MKLFRRKKRIENSHSAETSDNRSSYTKHEDHVSTNLQENEQLITNAYKYPHNRAIALRKVYIASIQKEALIFYVAGAVDVSIIEEHIIQPLVQAQNINTDVSDDKNIASYILQNVLTTTNGALTDSLSNAINLIVNGHTVIFIEDSIKAITIETAGFIHRSVEQPTIENYVRGPKEAFVESMFMNLSLIRKHVRTPKLICEVVNVGQLVSKQVSVLYIDEIADLDLVNNIKAKIEQVNVDAVINLNILEQYIEERPYSLITTSLVTERPDRTASFLLEGHVALLMENSPIALVLPVTFWSQFHTGEDHYSRWIDGNFLRIVRFIALLSALFIPSTYIAISTFHPEMLPTDLMLAIAANRERVPFSSIMEIFFMEIMFEILREAGMRIPTVIGPTIGIVGALTLGQAAVDANIVSPIMVIIVAITGLASFAIADVSLSYSVRIYRFVLLIVATFTGFVGIAVTTLLLITYMNSIKSFGVPFLSPFTPSYPSSKDFVLRPTIQNQWLRPLNLNPQKKVRMKKPGEDKG